MREYYQNKMKKKTMAIKKRVVTFKEGNLENIRLYLTEDYQRVTYPSGDTDFQMMDDINRNKPTGKMIFDVGTFIGASSLVFAKMVGKDGKIIGFEPNPFNRERISENLELNSDLKRRIKIFPMALSASDGTMAMTLSSQIDNGYSSTSRLSQSHPTLHTDQLPSGFEEITVDVMTLDNFISKNKFIPDILKVDIEGAEYDFLLGSRETIKKYKPILYIELHSEFCAVRCVELLHSMKYEITILHEEEDNRLMIKAEFNRNLNPLPEHLATMAQKNLDSALSMIRFAEKVLNHSIQKETQSELQMQKWKTEIDNLEEQNLLLEEKGIDLESRNIVLTKALAAYENSNSWRITKPLRLINNFLHHRK